MNFSIKRAFLIKASKSCTAPIFSVRSLASTSGRLDVIIRCIFSAFIWNGLIRKDTKFYAVLEGPPSPPLVIEIDGSELNYLPNNELGMANLIIKLMRNEKIRGFKIYKENFKNLVTKLKSKYNVLYLHEMGKDIRKMSFNPKDKYLFILGDHIGIDKESERYLLSLKIPLVSLGPISYLSSQCIILVHEELDRRII